MKARYIRISTPNQNFERQLLKKHSEEVLFIDKISGSISFKDRLEGNNLMDKVSKGEINQITVKAVDRLGRNILDILTTIEFFEINLCNLKVENLGINSLIDGKPNPAFKMIVSVLANVAEMERNSILERQREGIKIAKAKGIYKGRKRGTILSDKDFLFKYKNVVKDLKSGISIRKTALIHNISATTVQKVKHLSAKLNY
ncbi:recombinase family protein [Celeribacter sp.]|uniref:recombinase family protein n=1 Tax=Celeribacter sp. TaxID=1890673 RepID=UPI003A8DD35D